MTNRLKIIGIIVLAAAFLSMAQVVSLIFVSDTAIISMAKTQAKEERDQGREMSAFHSKTDTEIDKIIESRHDAIIKNVRKEYVRVIPLKLGLGFLILAASFLLLVRNKFTPRFFVLVVGVVQLLVLISSFKSVIRGLEREIADIPVIQVAVDMAWLCSLVLSAGACLTAFALLAGQQKRNPQTRTPE